MIQTHNTIFSFRHTTILRGIAILLVIIQHIGGGWTNLFTPLGGTGVALFLIISGFGINESYNINRTDKYWIKKILRVFLPYIFFESIFFMFQKTDFKFFVLDILCIKTNYWYVGYIFRCYLIYYIIVYFAPQHVIKLLLICSIVMFFISTEIEAEQSLSFVFGVFLSKNQRKYLSYFKYFKHAGFVLLLISLFALATKQTPFIRNLFDTYFYYLIQLLIKLPLSIAILLFTYNIIPKFNFNFLHFLGLISYELYLIHMKWLPLIDRKLINIPMFLLISIALSYIFYRYNNIVNNKLITIYEKIKMK